MWAWARGLARDGSMRAPGDNLSFWLRVRPGLSCLVVVMCAVRIVGNHCCDMVWRLTKLGLGWCLGLTVLLGFFAPKVEFEVEKQRVYF